MNASSIQAQTLPGVTSSLAVEETTGQFIAQFETGSNSNSVRQLLFAQDLGIRGYDDITATLLFNVTCTNHVVVWTAGVVTIVPCSSPFADQTSGGSSYIIGFTDYFTFWGVSLSQSNVYPVQGVFGNPFLEDPGSITNPFLQQYCTDTNRNINVSGGNRGIACCRCQLTRERVMCADNIPLGSEYSNDQRYLRPWRCHPHVLVAAKRTAKVPSELAVSRAVRRREQPNYSTVLLIDVRHRRDM